MSRGWLAVGALVWACGPTVAQDDTSDEHAWWDDDEAHDDTPIDEHGCPTPTRGTLAIIARDAGAIMTVANDRELLPPCGNGYTIPSCDGPAVAWVVALVLDPDVDGNEVVPGDQGYEAILGQAFAERGTDGSCRKSEAAALGDGFHLEVVHADDAGVCGWIDGFRPDAVGEPITVAFTASWNDPCG